ncbi:MAG: bacterioferritin-associated ferredoxin [Cellvibrionaceae bacterium]
MYVCLCNNVTDRAIKRSVRNGAENLQAVQNELGVANQCGRCACLANDIIHETLDDLYANNSQALPYAAA